MKLPRDLVSCFDAFLSHNAKDKAVVRPPVEGFRQDGLNVPFHFGIRIFAARHVGPCIWVGLGAVGGRHVWEGHLALSQSGDSRALLDSPAVIRPHFGRPGVLEVQSPAASKSEIIAACFEEIA